MNKDEWLWMLLDLNLKLGTFLFFLFSWLSDPGYTLKNPPINPLAKKSLDLLI